MRIALGATTANVTRLVLWQSLRVVGGRPRRRRRAGVGLATRVHVDACRRADRRHRPRLRSAGVRREPARASSRPARSRRRSPRCAPRASIRSPHCGTSSRPFLACARALWLSWNPLAPTSIRPLYTCKLQFGVGGQPGRRLAAESHMPHPPPDDITARHLAKVVESSDDAIVSKDLNGIIRSWNRAAERMFGYTAAEAVGRSIRMIIPADRQSEEDMVLSRIRAGKAVAHFETIRQRKDGTLIPISLTVSPIYDDAGTRHRRVEDRPRHQRPEARRRRRAAARRGRSNRRTTRSSPRISTASSRPGIPRRSGCSATPRPKPIGRSIRMLIPAELQGEEDIVLAKIRAGEMVDHYETIRQRKDGAAAVDFVDRVADPRRRRRRSSAPRRSPATSPSGRACWPPRASRPRSRKSWAKSARSWRRRWTATPSSRRSPTRRRS